MARRALLLGAVLCASAQHSILDYGGVPDDDSRAAALANSAALRDCVLAANRSYGDASDSRVALVPEAARFTFFYVNGSDWVGLRDVTLVIDGELALYADIADPQWTYQTSGGSFSTLRFFSPTNLRITGRGKYVGNGYAWWWHVLVSDDDANRPSLLRVDQGDGVELDGVRFENSPKIHIMFKDSANISVHDMSVHVDTRKQRALLRAAGYWASLRSLLPSDAARDELKAAWRALSPADAAALRAPFGDELSAPPRSDARGADTDGLGADGFWIEKLLDLLGVPTFPLNTDGIDPGAVGVRIARVNVTNFDDAIAVKPMTRSSTFGEGSCTTDVEVRDVRVTFGLGATIGSVSPAEPSNCITNVLFERIDFFLPIKAVYIKSNPGDVGLGQIENITYRDIRAAWSLWYPLWIGPQQQNQPGGVDRGCSFAFPAAGACPSQWRVGMRGVRVENARFARGVMMPGVLLGNESNPYTRFVFENVTNTGALLRADGSAGFAVQQEYYSKHINGFASRGTEPVPSGLRQPPSDA